MVPKAWLGLAAGLIAFPALADDLVLHWEPSTCDPAGVEFCLPAEIARYSVYQSVDGGSFERINPDPIHPTVTSFPLTGLDPSRSYVWKVRVTATLDPNLAIYSPESDPWPPEPGLRMPNPPGKPWVEAVP